MNITTVIKSWPSSVLMVRTTDDDCYQQIATVAICW